MMLMLMLMPMLGVSLSLSLSHIAKRGEGRGKQPDDSESCWVGLDSTRRQDDDDVFYSGSRT